MQVYCMQWVFGSNYGATVDAWHWTLYSVSVWASVDRTYIPSTRQPQPQPQPPMENQPQPPSLTNPRFTLELEFVSSLANPDYLSHLAVNYPNLLGTAKSAHEDDDDSDSASRDAQAFAAYLAYLYSYWKTPEYAQFLTHPGATLRALRLLQEDAFRRDIIRPQVIEVLAGMGADSGQTAEAIESKETEAEKPDSGRGGSKT